MVQDDLPIFPDIPYSSIKHSLSRDIVSTEIDSPEKFASLLELLWREPHVRNYLISRKDGGLSQYILGAQYAGVMEHETLEMNWYEHPNYKNDYIRIDPNTDWDWEKEVVASQPMYTRMELRLTERERRRREGLAIAAAIAAATSTKDPPPKTRRDRLERHYREHQSLYWLVGTGLAVVGLGLAAIQFH